MNRHDWLEGASGLEAVFGPTPPPAPLPPTPEAERLEGALRAVQEGVVAYSPGMRVDHADAAAAAAMGTTSDEVRGESREGLAGRLLALAAAAVAALKALAGG